MDHRDALDTHATERYLLGELPAEEAEEFELHYFECPHCAAAVESGNLFVAAAREHFRERAPHPRAEPGKRSFRRTLAAFWRPAFTIPAMAALAAVIVYQNAVVIPGMKGLLSATRALPAVQLIGASRGDETVVHVPAGTPFVSLAADIPPGAPFREYICVLTRGGSEVSASVSPAPAEGQPVTILVPAGRLQSGSHQLTVFGRAPDGGRGEKISAYPFSVQFD